MKRILVILVFIFCSTLSAQIADSVAIENDWVIVETTPIDSVKFLRIDGMINLDTKTMTISFGAQYLNQYGEVVKTIALSGDAKAIINQGQFKQLLKNIIKGKYNLQEQ